MELALFVATFLEPDAILVEMVKSSEGFIITITKYWFVGEYVVTESETVIGLA